MLLLFIIEFSDVISSPSTGNSALSMKLFISGSWFALGLKFVSSKNSSVGPSKLTIEDEEFEFSIELNVSVFKSEIICW